MTDRMTAEQFKKVKAPRRNVDREGPVQIAIVNWLRQVLPKEALVHHCKNEIKRRGNSFAREIEKAKTMGMVPGFPDLIIIPFSTVGVFFLEVKSEGGSVQPNQTDIHEKMAALGYHVAVVRSIADVRQCLNEWNIGFVENLTVRGTIT